MSSPPIASLQPGQRQTIRLVLRGTPRPDRSDRHFRLLIDEIPAAEEGGQVRFALRLSLPVFARALPISTSNLAWRLDGRELVAINQGSRHARFSDLNLTGAGGQRIAVPPAATPYLLPGVERRWALPGLRGPLPSATLTGLAPEGSFRTELVAHAASAP